MPMAKEELRLFCLDTHIWIWLMNGDEKFKTAKWQKLFSSAKGATTFFIPAISVWEVGMLVSKKKIEISYSPLEWVYRGLQARGMQLVELSPEIALESCEIDKLALTDPADRIIVTTAKSLGAILLTADQQMVQYSRRNKINVIDAAKR